MIFTNSEHFLGCSLEDNYKYGGRCDYCNGYCCGVPDKAGKPNPQNKCSAVLTTFLKDKITNQNEENLHCISVPSIRNANSGCWCGLTCMGLVFF